MLKPIAMVAGVGFIGVILYKMLWMLFLPFIAMFVGAFFFVLKIALVVTLIWTAMWLVRKFSDKPAGSET